MVRRTEAGVGLGAAKHHEGSRGLTGIRVLPQINKGQRMPASKMYEPSVQGAARELHTLRDVPGAQGCSVLQVQAPPVGLSALHCEAAQPRSRLSALTGSGQGETLSLVGLLWCAQGKGSTAQCWP